MLASLHVRGNAPGVTGPVGVTVRPWPIGPTDGNLLFSVMRQLPLALDTKRHARTRSALQFAAATMAVWTLLALLSVAQTAVYLRDRAQEVPWDKLIVTR